MPQIQTPWGPVGTPDDSPSQAAVAPALSNTGDPMLDKAAQDVADYLNGRGNAQQAAAAQRYIDAATKQPSSGETSDQKQARQLAVQQAREDYQAAQNAASNQTRRDIAAGHDATSSGNQDKRDDTAVQIQGMKSDTSAGNAQTRAQSATDVANIRAGATDSAAQTRAGASTDVAQINAQSRQNVAQIDVAGKLADVNAQAQAQLAKLDDQFNNQVAMARQKYEQDKDLNAFNFALQDIRNAHLQQAMQIRQSLLEQQKEIYQLPQQQSNIEVQQANAETERQRLRLDASKQAYQQQQGAYQRQAANAQMQLGVLQKQSDMASGAIQSGVKLGVAPPMALVQAQFAPFAMAKQILSQLVNSGQMDQSRVPDALGITPTNFSTPTTGAAPMPDTSAWNSFGQSLGQPNSAPMGAPPPTGQSDDSTGAPMPGGM